MIRLALSMILTALPLAAGNTPPLPREAAPPARPADSSASVPTRTPPRRAPAASAPRGTRGNGAAAAPTTPPKPREIDPKHIDALIKVAEDVAPSWAPWLEAKREADPEALRKAIATNGQRLVSLAILRDHNPDLYQLKVSGLRLQATVGDLSKRFREAHEAGHADEAKKLLEELRKKAKEQVDLALKTRAEELKALDEQLKNLVKELQKDAEERQKRIDALIESLTTGNADEPIAPPPADGANSGAATPAKPAPVKSDEAKPAAAKPDPAAAK